MDTKTNNKELIIDNEVFLDQKTESIDFLKELNKKMDDLQIKTEERVKIKSALLKLNDNESKIKDKLYDLDLTYKDGLFYIIGGKKDNKNKYILNISIKEENLNTFLSSITVLLNEPRKLVLSGNKDFRRIMYGDNNEFVNQYLKVTKYDSDRELIYLGVDLNGDGSVPYYGVDSNNIIEELFKFVQNMKGIPKDTWEMGKNMEKDEPIGCNGYIGSDTIIGGEYQNIRIKTDLTQNKKKAIKTKTLN